MPWRTDPQQRMGSRMKPKKKAATAPRQPAARAAASAPKNAPPSPAAAAPPVAKRKVFLVDDHPIVRERLGELIAQEPDLEVCGEAEDAITAITAIEAAHPDVAVVDITLKDTYGIELIKNLKERCDVPVLVLSMHDESRSEEHTSELQSQSNLVCRLLLEKKKK